MLETCGSAGKGCTFPVIESYGSQAMAGVGSRVPGRYSPMLTVVPDNCPGQQGGKDPTQTVDLTRPPALSNVVRPSISIDGRG